ncbi:MAG: TlpA family protein disulfide reductase [Planctomycetes bacterium]|nr:TlpA family protein disulfide reductase [Planctomycetota bacterium]
MRIRMMLIALAAMGVLLCACHSTHTKEDTNKEDACAGNNEPADNADANNESKSPEDEEFCLLPPDARPEGLAGKIAVGDTPPDFKLKDPNTGKEVMLSSLKGKTVLLFFWASWCPYCKKAFSADGPMNALTNDAVKPDSGLIIINVGTDVDDTEVSQEAFLKTNGVKSISTHDDDGLEKKYGVLGIPTAVVIGREGKIITFGSYRPKEYREPLLEYLKQECVSNPEGS